MQGRMDSCIFRSCFWTTLQRAISSFERSIEKKKNNTFFFWIRISSDVLVGRQSSSSSCKFGALSNIKVGIGFFPHRTHFSKPHYFRLFTTFDAYNMLILVNSSNNQYIEHFSDKKKSEIFLYILYLMC